MNGADGREPLRIGVLGAARISALSIVEPARLTGARLVAVAARDRGRAESFAAEHGVERVHDSYADVLADPEVEAVYNPLANSLHAPWNIRALRAGKHVLSEKPSAGTAEQARVVRDVVRGTDLTYMEGFHYRYHPVVTRLHELLADGELGELRQVQTVMEMPAPADDDLRWQFDLAGGAVMDLGCYSLHTHRELARFAGGPPVVTRATAGERAGRPGVDEWLTAELRFPSGATGTAACHMAADAFLMRHRVVGTRGEATIPDFIHPHEDDRLLVDSEKGSRTEHLGTRSSYTYQLDAFTAAVRDGAPVATDADDAVATMELIDDSYRAAGLPLRPTPRL